MANPQGLAMATDLNRRSHPPMKPYPCPKHPDGLVESSYDLTQTVLNGLPSGEGVRSNYKLRCHECGMELETLGEFVERSKAEERLQKDLERAASILNNGWKP